jgi:hypothetical protein
MLLDSQCYPHLFDLIISHAPHAVLLPLRATSRANRMSADKALHAHRIILTADDAEIRGQPPDGKIRTVVSTPHGRLPAFASWATDGKTADELTDEHGKWRDIAMPSPAFNPKFTDVVDLVGPVCNGYIQPLLASLHPDLSEPQSCFGDPPITLRVRADELNRSFRTTYPPGDISSLKHTANCVVHLLPFPLYFTDYDRHPGPARLVELPGARRVHNLWIHPGDYFECNPTSISLDTENLCAGDATYIFHRATRTSRHPLNTESRDHNDFHHIPALLEVSHFGWRYTSERVQR